MFGAAVSELASSRFALCTRSIWHHLVQITKDGNKTVIITTHYIEEARQAHAVRGVDLITISR